MAALLGSVDEVRGSPIILLSGHQKQGAQPGIDPLRPRARAPESAPRAGALALRAVRARRAERVVEEALVEVERCGDELADARCRTNDRRVGEPERYGIGRQRPSLDEIAGQEPDYGR
jgi:hypothetical protein